MEIAKQVALDTFAFFLVDFLIALVVEPLWAMLPAALILGFVAITTYHGVLQFLIWRYLPRSRMVKGEGQSLASPR